MPTIFVCFRPRSHGTLSLQNRNSLGQDPCLIASILEAACREKGEDPADIHESRPPEETSSSDLERSPTPFSQIRLTSHHSTALMAAMLLLGTRQRTASANATRSPTGASSFITLSDSD